LFALWPFVEARAIKDHEEHHLLDRPRDVPFRTAVGAGGLAFVTVLTLAGGNDVLALMFNVPVESVTWFLRVAIFVVPAAVAGVTYRIALELRDGDRRVFGRKKAIFLERGPSGGYDEKP